MKKYRNEHKKFVNSMSSMKPSEARYKVVLSDSLNCPAPWDYSADFSAIQSPDLGKLSRSSNNIVVKTFQLLLKLQLAVSVENTIATASKKVTDPITITLPGSGMPVRLQNVESLVVYQKMSNVLLGRPFLDAHGFSFKSHLKRVRLVVNNRSIVKLQNLPYILAALS